MKNVLKFFLLSLVLLSMVSCVTRLGSFTVISTKNIDWSRAGEFKRGSRVDGQDLAHIIILFPTKFMINIETAVDKAIEKVPGAVALVDVVLKDKRFYIPYIYGQLAFIVEGTALIDPKLISNADELEDSSYYIGLCDRKSNITFSKVSKEQYEATKTRAED